MGAFIILFINNHLCQQFNNWFAKDARLLKQQVSLVRWMHVLRSVAYASGFTQRPPRNLTPLCVRLPVYVSQTQKRSMPTSLARATTSRSTQSCSFAVVV